MNIEWVAVDKCPVCGGAGKYILTNQDQEINAPIRLYRCDNCKSHYHNPRMSQNSMNEYYSTGVYRSTKERDLQHKKINKVLLAAEVKVLMIDAFRRDVNANIERSLDYGCSRGFTVKELERRFGGEAIGYDIYKDPGAVIDVVDSKEKLTGKFDLIACIHTLEHLPNPIEEIDWMVSMLNKDGILFIEIPFTNLIFAPHPILFSRESVFYMMKRLKARYIFYDMQYATENGLIVCQPNRPIELLPLSYHQTVVGVFSEDEAKEKYSI